MIMDRRKRLVIGICGASGAIYGQRLLMHLSRHPVDVRCILSDAGEAVLHHETGLTGASLCQQVQNADTRHPDFSITRYAPGNLFAPPASGSFRHDGMVIAPCTMKTAGALASGMPATLLERSADVCLKEKRPLILLPRETPLSVIHLKNLLTLAQAGVLILPPAPAFYHQPKTVADLVDSVLARVLDHMGLPQTLAPEWQEPV